MFKGILISGLLCTFLSASSFDEFLQEAVKNSPYLESAALAVKQTKEQGDTLTRYQNPTLGLSVASFTPESGSNDVGYSINYSQPLRLWGVQKNNKALVRANINNTTSSYIQKKASFIRDISLLFTKYSNSKMLLSLADEELVIAKKIYDISLAQFQNGRISKGVKLQAQVDYEISENSINSISLTSMNSYYALLKFAGITKELELEDSYNFKITSKENKINNPNIELLKTEKQQALKEAKVNSKSVKWIDIYAEVESESEQSIVRAGLNLPLTLWSDKSQEKTIATLQANRSELLIQNETNRLNIELTRLKKERKSLLKLIKSNEKILKTELTLLSIYEDGYRIANINLLQLQDIKNKVIETKRALILLQTALNINAIYTNYNQGNYND